MATHSYKTVLKKLMFKLGFGFKKKRIEACLGDEIPLELDESLFKDSVKRAKKTTKKNSLARWSTEDGSEITDSKTVQDNQGNTLTHTSINGTFDTILSNDTGSTVHAIEATKGRPIYRMLIPEKQLVDTYISDKDYSYNVFLKDIENKGLAASCFKISRKGNTTHPYQYSAFAILSENTGNISSGVSYYLGQGTPLTIIDNEGGSFFPGAGNNPQRPAMFTCKEAAKYLVYVSAVVNQNDPRRDCEIQAAFSVETSTATNRQTGAINIIPQNFRKNTATVLGPVKANPGDRIKFYIYTISLSSETTWFIERTIGATYTTYVGIYCLG